jgi:hypothetical protein
MAAPGGADAGEQPADTHAHESLPAKPSDRIDSRHLAAVTALASALHARAVGGLGWTAKADVVPGEVAAAVTKCPAGCPALTEAARGR